MLAAQREWPSIVSVTHQRVDIERKEYIQDDESVKARLSSEHLEVVIGAPGLSHL
jgi:predicted DNA binding CopG/RHH family protein